MVLKPRLARLGLMKSGHVKLLFFIVRFLDKKGSNVPINTQLHVRRIIRVGMNFTHLLATNVDNDESAAVAQFLATTGFASHRQGVES